MNKIILISLLAGAVFASDGSLPEDPAEGHCYKHQWQEAVVISGTQVIVVEPEHIEYEVIPAEWDEQVLNVSTTGAYWTKTVEGEKEMFTYSVAMTEKVGVRTLIKPAEVVETIVPAVTVELPLDDVESVGSTIWSDGCN